MKRRETRIKEGRGAIRRGEKRSKVKGRKERK